MADAELSSWFHVTTGMAAGCPQAPLLAKTFLEPILGPFQAKYQDLHLNGWVDDIGFDGSRTDAQALATRVTTAWKELSMSPQAAGLKVNNQKTAFIVTDKTTHKALPKLLGPDDPPSNERSRYRPSSRTQTTHCHPTTTVQEESTETNTSQDPQAAKPQNKTQTTQKSNPTSGTMGHGLHSGGKADVVYDQHSHKYVDPGDQVVLQHIHALHTLLAHWPPDHLQHIEQAWLELRNQLRRQTYPWCHMKGPLAATLAYLHEWGWTTSSLYSWTRHETAYMTEARIDMRAEWWVLEAAVMKEAQQRRHRLANKKNCQHLVSGIDWPVAHKPRPTTSDPGTKQPSTTSTGTNQRHVPCATSQPHQSTSCGLAPRPEPCTPAHPMDGTTSRPNPYGHMERSPKNHKTIWSNHWNFKDMVVGKDWTTATLAGSISHRGCHTDVSRQESSGVDLRPLHPQLLVGRPATITQAWPTGLRPRPEPCSGTPHTGSVCPNTGHGHCAAGISLGGLDYVCMYVCVYVCMYVCMYVRMYVCIFLLKFGRAPRQVFASPGSLLRRNRPQSGLRL